MTNDDIEPCELYLTLQVTDIEAAAARIEAARSSGAIASLLLRTQKHDPCNTPQLKSLVEKLHQDETIVMVEDDAALAQDLQADGVHVGWSENSLEAYQKARLKLGASALIGADAGRSRHVAMQLGEAGADYVAFGIPEHVDDKATARQRQLDLITWWAEIFEPACIAFDTTTSDDIAHLAAAGADFIALPLADGTSPDELRSYVQEMRALLERESQKFAANQNLETT